MNHRESMCLLLGSWPPSSERWEFGNSSFGKTAPNRPNCPTASQHRSFFKSPERNPLPITTTTIKHNILNFRLEVFSN